MPRILHGAVVTIEQAEAAAAGKGAMNVPFSMAVMPDFKRFDFLFPDLQNDPANLLPTSATIVANLKLLGAAMHDTDPQDQSNAALPAAYTYLGQFIDHDITFEVTSDDLAKISDPDLAPLTLADIKAKIRNT